MRALRSNVSGSAAGVPAPSSSVKPLTDPDERFDLMVDLFVEGLAQRARA